MWEHLKVSTVSRTVTYRGLPKYVRIFEFVCLGLSVGIRPFKGHSLSDYTNTTAALQIH